MAKKWSLTRDSQIRMITRYNNQGTELYGVFNTNWHLLIHDPKISVYISDKPQLVARQVLNLKDKFIESKKKIISRTFPCRWCNICQYTLAGDTFNNPQTRESYTLKHYIHCRTANVVYAFNCPCHKVYMRQTIQELRKRIQRHLSNISLAGQDVPQEKTITSVASHFLKHHDGKYGGIKIVDLDLICSNIRGGAPYNGTPEEWLSLDL